MSSDRTTLVLARSILDAAGILHLVRGDIVQDLFGWGRLGGPNRITGPVRILVNPEDEEVARQLLLPAADIHPCRVSPIMRVIAILALLGLLYNLLSSIIRGLLSR